MKTLNITFKSILLLALFIVIGTEVQAGGEKFQRKMGETLQMMGQARDAEGFQAAGNQFLVIAKAEKSEWLPYYYHAYCYIIANFTVPGQQEEQDRLLDEADASIQELMKNHGDNVEVHALNSFYLMARLAVNPQERGQQYSMLTQMAVGKGMAIDAKNPRLRYVKLSTDIGTAGFFGQDTAPYCESANALLSDWDNFAVASPLHPSWGKDLVEGLIQENCKSEK
jgi:hypothetical protein